MRLLFSKIALSLSLVLTLCACGSEDSNQTIGTNPCKNSIGNYSMCEEYILPPMPDKKENDKTLLGIDSNNNGVRDDVERWLIMQYKDHHPIVTEIGLQTGRAHQFMLANSNEWREAHDKISAALYCNFYFENYATFRNEPILIDHLIATHNKQFRTVQHNTESRIRAYLAYDRKLSGGVYELPPIEEQRALCNFNVDRFLKEYPVEEFPNVESIFGREKY